MARAVRTSVNEWRTTAKHEECRGSPWPRPRPTLPRNSRQRWRSWC
jgi:hypothetical protein